MKKKRIAIYLRNDTAVKGQLKRITKEIGNNRMNTLTIYNDIDASGTSRDRVELNRLLEDVKNKTIDIVYVESIHILSRDIEYASQIYDLILLKGVQLISIEDSLSDMFYRYLLKRLCSDLNTVKKIKNYATELRQLPTKFSQLELIIIESVLQHMKDYNSKRSKRSYIATKTKRINEISCYLGIEDSQIIQLSYTKEHYRVTYLDGSKELILKSEVQSNVSNRE